MTGCSKREPERPVLAHKNVSNGRPAAVPSAPTPENGAPAALRVPYAARGRAASFRSNAAMSSPRFAFAAATERSLTGP